MKIRNDGILQLNVPMKTKLEVIEEFIISKYSWLQKKYIENYNSQNHKPLVFEDGEVHLYFGKEYCLQLIVSTQSFVEIKNDKIIVFHRKNSIVKNILNRWYRQQALDFFNKRTHHFAKNYDFPSVKKVTVRNMKARWGSCNSRSEITYNIHLIKAPLENIDYVVLHELCHLIHPNHGVGFYQLQSQVNPDWKKQKYILNIQGYRYIN